MTLKFQWKSFPAEYAYALAAQHVLNITFSVIVSCIQYAAICVLDWLTRYVNTAAYICINTTLTDEACEFAFL